MLTQRIWDRVAGPGLLFVLTVLFHWKLVLTNQYTWLESADIGSLILPWFQFQAGEWHSWRFPLWDPNSWAGQPLFGQAQPGAAYPLNWLLFWMPLDHGWLRQDVLHWFYVLVHYLAGLSAYALCRDLGRSRFASVLGGVIYSLGGYVASIDSPQMLHGAVWAPLVFLYLFRAVSGERVWRNAVLSGFFLGVAWLAGHHQMQVFLSLAVLGVWIWARNVWGIVAFGMTALTSAFQTLPAWEYGRLAVRWVGADLPQGLHETVPYPVHAMYALKPLGLLGIFVVGVEQGQYNPFIGIAALSLAVLGAITWWRLRFVRWLTVLAICGILFALGANSVFHGMFYALAPLVEKARVPEAATLIFALGVAPLAAYGLDGGKGCLDVRTFSRVLAGLGVMLAFGALFFYAARVNFDQGMIITAMAAFAMAALLASKGDIRVLALALVLFELGNVTDTKLATSDPKTHPYLYKLAEHSDLITFVKGRGEPARIFYDGQAIPYNIGDWYGVEAFNAYAASVPVDLWKQQVFADRVQDLLGIRYYFGPKPTRGDVREVFEGRSGMKIFENARAFPRVWAVHRTQASGELSDASFDGRTTAILEKAPVLAQCDGDEVWMPQHHPNHVVIKAEMACRGIVVLSDNFYPGWSATVDGHAAAILKTDLAFRGVVLEAGSHTVEMVYRPWSVFLGGLMTVVACGIAVVAGRAA